MSNRFEKIILFILILLLPSQLAFHFWPSWSFAAGRPLDYLSPTLYFTDLLIIVLILINSNSILLYIKTLISRHARPVLLVMAFIVLNLIFSVSPAVTLFAWIRFLEYFMLAYVFQKNLLLHFNFRLPLSIALVWTVLLLSLQFISQHSLGGLWILLGERPLQITSFAVAKTDFRVFNIDLGYLLRPYATFPHPNALAGFLLVSYFLVKSKLIKLLVSVALFFTFSRTAIFVFIFLNIIKFKHRLIRPFSIFLLVFSTAYIIGASEFSFSGASITERLTLAHTSLNMTFTRPITGVGLGAFIPAIVPQGISLLQPVHNIFLLLVSELGLPFVFVLILIAYKLFPQRHNPLLLAILMTGMADHYWLTLHQNQLLLVLIVVLCLNPKKSAKTSIT